MLSHGVDIVEVGRIEKAIERYSERFTNRIYTNYERSLCDSGDWMSRWQKYAGYWAVKEATMKALGTGNKKGVRFLDIGTQHEISGKPYLVLSGIAEEVSRKIGVKSMVVSISHEREYAIASVIFELYG